MKHLPGFMMTAIACLAVPALAVETLLTPGLFMSLSRVTDVSLSPEGTEAFYLLNRPRQPVEGIGPQVNELWRVSTQGGGPVRVGEGTVAAGFPAYSPDGSWRSWTGRAGEEEVQVYAERRDGTGRRRLTNVESGVERYVWSPSGRWLAYTAADPRSAAEKQAIAAGRDGLVVDRNPAQLRLRVLEVATGEEVVLTDGTLSVHDLAWSPDEAALAVTAAPSPSEDDEALRNKLYLVPRSGDGVRQAAATPTSALADVHFSPNGKWLAWRGGSADNDPANGSVFVVPVAGGERRELTAGAEDTAMRVDWLQGKPQTLVVRGIRGQRTILYTLDPRTGARRDLPFAAQDSVEPIINSDSIGHASYGDMFDRRGTHLAVVASSRTHPNEVFFGRVGQPLRRLTNHNPQLEGVTFAEQEETHWSGPDGLRIEGVLIKPVHYTPGRRYPVVLQIHGGSEDAYQNGWMGDWAEDMLPQVLAARGFVVLCPNYRGSLGRGAAFGMAEHDDVMGKSYEDMVAGLDHLIALGIADAERTGISGYSWGGMAASWAATYGSARWKAAVGGGVMTNWVTHAGVSKTRIHDTSAHWNRILYDGNYELFLKRSPIYHVDKAHTPMLIMQGERDMDAPTAQAWELYTALKWKGVPVEFVLYPRDTHSLEEQAHQQDYLERAVAWFERYLMAPTQ